MTMTVLGGAGFIGRAILGVLAAENDDVYAPGRDDLDWNRDLGDLIYAIGFTADFRGHPYETIDAHVSVLSEVLRRGRYDSLLYLSSTRVYRDAEDTREESPLIVRPSDPDDVYALSKLTGESLCLASKRSTVRVARLSNVYGFDPRSENFLAAVLREAAAQRTVRLRSAMASSRDYVHVGDVARLVLSIARRGTQRLYNVASGTNTTNAQIAAGLTDLGVAVTVEPDAPTFSYPEVRIERVVREFDFAPRPLLANLPALYGEYERVEA